VHFNALDAVVRTRDPLDFVDASTFFAQDDCDEMFVILSD